MCNVGPISNKKIAAGDCLAHDRWVLPFVLSIVYFLCCGNKNRLPATDDGTGASGLNDTVHVLHVLRRSSGSR